MRKIQFSIKINRHEILKRNEGFGLAGAGGATEFSLIIHKNPLAK